MSPNDFDPDFEAWTRATDWVEDLPENDFWDLLHRHEQAEDLTVTLSAAADAAWTAAMAAYAANEDAKREFSEAFRKQAVERLNDALV